MAFALSPEEVARIRAEEIAKGNLPDVMDVEELAVIMKCSPRLVEQKPIPRFYLGTRTMRFLKKSVIQFLEAEEEVIPQ